MVNITTTWLTNILRDMNTKNYENQFDGVILKIKKVICFPVHSVEAFEIHSIYGACLQ